MDIDRCHFLPLVDARGEYQVICAYEVDEIATVARTRMPPWTREVFPSVRAHMLWMDTEAGPVELLIGQDNTQWLLIHLEDSRDQEVNMRLMKSAFGHQFMIMGGWGTAFYPRDESMRYRGDPAGEPLSSAEEARKIQLGRVPRLEPGHMEPRRQRSTWDPGMRESGPKCWKLGKGSCQEAVTPEGSEQSLLADRWAPADISKVEEGAPPQADHHMTPPNAQSRRTRGGQWSGRVSAARPQHSRGQPRPDPRGMPGLLQPPGPADTMQQLALMMAVMVLGIPQAHGCHVSKGSRMPWGESGSEARVCPPVVLGNKAGVTVVGDQLDPDGWRRLPAVHCQATQSVLTFMCSLDGHSRKVKYEKFRQPCRIQAAAS